MSGNEYPEEAKGRKIKIKKTSMQNIDWNKLKAQDRVKDINMPWTEEEDKARRSGVPAEDIRSGKWQPAKPAPKEKEETQTSQSTGATAGQPPVVPKVPATPEKKVLKKKLKPKK